MADDDDVVVMRVRLLNVCLESNRLSFRFMVRNRGDREKS